MKNKFLILTLTAIILSFSANIMAQNYSFVMLETTVTSEDIPTSDTNPTERRFYVSNVVQMPNNLRSYQMNKAADDYFTAYIVEPLKAKGIKVHYYENDVKLDCGSAIAAKDKADAEAKLANCIADLKERGRVSIYSFTWTFGNAKGLETAQPTLIFRDKESPNYLPKGEVVATPKVEKPLVNANVNNTKKIKKGKKN